MKNLISRIMAILDRMNRTLKTMTVVTYYCVRERKFAYNRKWLWSISYIMCGDLSWTNIWRLRDLSKKS